MKQTFATLAAKFSTDLYCAVLPSGWSLTKMSWDYKAGMQAHYKKSAATVDIWELNVCALSPNPCTSYYPTDFGSQAYGPLTGNMDGDATSKIWTNVVHTSKPNVLYVISGKGMTEAQFRGYSAAMHKIG